MTDDTPTQLDYLRMMASWFWVDIKDYDQLVEEIDEEIREDEIDE